MPAFKDMQLSLEELQDLLVKQHQQIEALEALVRELQAENDRLKRQNKRQAAPFSKGAPNPHPKKPGRKPRSENSGSSNFSFRQAPTEQEYTEPVVDVAVSEHACPDCGGALEHRGTELATVTDIPKVVRPRVRAFRVSVCRCTECGKSVRGVHPEIASDQYGASAHRVGQKAMAAAHLLHYDLGIPVRKAPLVLKWLCGISLSQGAISQDALKRSQGAVGETYKQLRDEIKNSKRVHTDDTGWRIAGENAHLMAFDTDDVAVYQIRRRHRNEEVRELIPSDYQGTMCTDRGRSYDARQFESVKQQKCLSHIHRSIAIVLENKQGEPREFAEELKKLLQEATGLWHGYHKHPTTLLDKAVFQWKTKRLQGRMTHHLRDRQLDDKDNQRLLNELGSHHDRGNLLRFLNDPSVEPTNNRAERALRPAVIARKVSHCSKNTQGAEAFTAFISVIRTLHKRGSNSPLEQFCQVLETGTIPQALPP